MKEKKTRPCPECGKPFNGGRGEKKREMCVRCYRKTPEYRARMNEEYAHGARGWSKARRDAEAKKRRRAERFQPFTSQTGQ